MVWKERVSPCSSGIYVTAFLNADKPYGHKKSINKSILIDYILHKLYNHSSVT